uniref:Uncharacterized protein n=1 Tax=Aplanochytrium stocchinoi TaxID=215587 RepID=A0A7S3V2C6_9STRA
MSFELGMSEVGIVEKLNLLVAEWREPGLIPVHPKRVIPDTTNRENTGLSVEHVHYIANKMQSGFKKRMGRFGHDLPILVREDPSKGLGKQSLEKWQDAVTKNEFLPKVDHSDSTEIFTSLGNGHFFQALNLFHTKSPGMFITGSKYYQVLKENDSHLHEALTVGVEAVVLRSDISRNDRKFISLALNSMHNYKWNVKPDGTALVSPAKAYESESSFEALSKTLDSYELGELVRFELSKSERQSRL